MSQAVRPPAPTETSPSTEASPSTESSSPESSPSTESTTPSADSPSPSSDTTSAAAAAPPPAPSPTVTTPSAGPATLTLTPTSVAAGDYYKAEVSGFQPGETITFSANPGNITGGTTTVDSSGSTTNDIHVQPDVPPGDYTITVTGQTSGLTADAHLTVTASTASP